MMQVATARELWADRDGNTIDDCTILVVFLETVPINKPRSICRQLGQPRAFEASSVPLLPPAQEQQQQQPAEAVLQRKLGQRWTQSWDR